MPDTSSITTPIMDLYQHLDKLQDLLKIVQADYKVKAKEFDFTMALPADKVQQIKEQYEKLAQNVRNCAGRLPSSL